MVIDVAMIFPNTFPDASMWEGSRTRVLELASGLLNIGFKVSVVCIKSSSYKYDIFDGIILSYIGKALPIKLHYALFPITSLIRLPSLLRSLKPKIMHFHMSTSALPKLFFPSLTNDAITIYDPHDLFFLKGEFFRRLNKVPSPIGHLCDVVDIQLLRKFDAIFVTTPLMRNFVRKYVRGKIYIIPNSVDTQLFSMAGRTMRHLF
ncbi:MAG: glycosyltransferase family 4 protein, partial [Nitrososphaeria archaeon]